MRRTFKRSLTLIEIVLVLVVLGIITSLVGVKSHELIQAYAFKNEAKKVAQLLQTSRYLAQTYRADIFVTINSEGIQITSSEPPLQALPFVKEPFLFSAISFVYDEKGLQPPLSITYRASGFTQSPQTIQLCSKNQKIPSRFINP